MLCIMKINKTLNKFFDVHYLSNCLFYLIKSQEFLYLICLLYYTRKKIAIYETGYNKHFVK